MIRKILCATDLTEASAPALRAAIGLARELGAKMTLLHVVEAPYEARPWFASYDDADTALMRKIAHAEQLSTREILGRLASEANATQGLEPVDVDIAIATGIPSDVILAQARERGADLIIMGTHGRRGAQHLLMGSIAERVVRLAPCAVWTVKPTSPGGDVMLDVKKILVPVDFSEASRAALRWACELSRKLDATLVLFHAYAPPGLALPEGVVLPRPETMSDFLATMDRELERFRAEALERGAVRVETRSEQGIAPASAIARCAQDDAFDLVVMSTHGRTGLAHALMGSVAEKVVRTAACPVLTVRAPRPS